MKNEESQLRKELEDATKVWAHRIVESDRARHAEAIARRDVNKAAGKYVRYLTRRYA